MEIFNSDNRITAHAETDERYALIASDTLLGITMLHASAEQCFHYTITRFPGRPFNQRLLLQGWKHDIAAEMELLALL